MKFKLGDMVIYQQFGYGFQIKKILDNKKYLIEDYDFGEFMELEASEDELKPMDHPDIKNIKVHKSTNGTYESKVYIWTDLNGKEYEIYTLNSNRMMPTDFVKRHIQSVKNKNNVKTSILDKETLTIKVGLLVSSSEIIKSLQKLNIEFEYIKKGIFSRDTIEVSGNRKDLDYIADLIRGKK